MSIEVPPKLTEEEINEINREKEIKAQRKVQKEIEDKIAEKKRKSEVQRLLPEAKKRITKTLGLQANLGDAFSEKEIKETFKGEEWEIAIDAALEYFEKNQNNPEKIKHKYDYMPNFYKSQLPGHKSSCLHYADMEERGAPPTICFFYKEYANSDLPPRKPESTEYNIADEIIDYFQKKPLMLVLTIVLIIVIIDFFTAK